MLEQVLNQQGLELGHVNQSNFVCFLINFVLRNKVHKVCKIFKFTKLWSEIVKLIVERITRHQIKCGDIVINI